MLSVTALLKMLKDLLGDSGILYAGDDFYWAFAPLADLDVYVEHPFLVFASRLLPWMACIPVLQEQKPVMAI
jgi:hypothetical protein